MCNINFERGHFLFYTSKVNFISFYNNISNMKLFKRLMRAYNTLFFNQIIMHFFPLILMKSERVSKEIKK